MASWIVFNSPPVSAVTLDQVAQAGVEAMAALANDGGGQSLESQLTRFCNRLRGSGNLVSKPIMAVSVPTAATGNEWQNAFDSAFNRSKIEILKFRANEIEASMQTGLQSNTTNGQTEMNSQATQESASRAAASLVGLTVVASFSGLSDSNESSLGLCAIANSDLQRLIEKLAKSPAEIKLNPAATSPLDLIDSLTPQQLSKLFGSRLLSDSTGQPIIIAFGQAAVNYKGANQTIRAKFRDASASMAEGKADHQIAEYLAGAAIYSDQQLSSQLVEITTGDSSESQKTQAMEKIATDLSSRVKVNLVGLSTVRRWILPATKTTPEMVGTVRLWQPLQ